jgi:hypothetical protein
MTKRQPTNTDLERIVIDCVSRTSGVDASRISAETDVVFGLGMAGDDGVDLISDVRRVTGTQLREYDFYKHFGPEAAFSMHSGEPLTVAQLIDLVKAELSER